MLLVQLPLPAGLRPDRRWCAGEVLSYDAGLSLLPEEYVALCAAAVWLLCAAAGGGAGDGSGDGPNDQ